MKLRDLMEAVGDVTLYRGDSTSVARFSVEHTSSEGLVGRGIYLSTSKDVAREFTVKGHPDAVAESEPGEDIRHFMRRILARDYLSDVLPPSKAYHACSRIFRGLDIDGDVDWSDLQDAIFVQLAPTYLDHIQRQYKRAYAKFQKDMNGRRILNSGRNWVIVSDKADGGHISAVELSAEDNARVFDADAPMDTRFQEKLLDIISGMISHDPRTYQLDYRYEGGRAENWYDWQKKFAQYGATFAWAGRDIGGEGLAMSLIEFVVGTHVGQMLQHQGAGIWEPIRSALESEGYIGIRFEGGDDIGGDLPAGGSAIRSQIYCLWDEELVASQRQETQSIGVSPTDPRITKNYRFNVIMKPLIDQVDRKVRGTQVVNIPDNVQAVLDQWIASGNWLKDAME